MRINEVKVGNEYYILAPLKLRVVMKGLPRVVTQDSGEVEDIHDLVVMEDAFGTRKTMSSELLHPEYPEQPEFY